MKKIGHTGTLDPEAEGVLPVCLGKGTKLCDMLTDRSKTYRAVLLLGRETDTQDTTGQTLRESPVEVTEAEVREAVMSFRGHYEQIPPMYSALKVNGKKLYELARAGKEVERQARSVEILDISVESVDLPRVTMTVSCSKGTYIRTLCYDIGRKLGCGGCMESLLRTRVDRFFLADSLTLAEIERLRDEGTVEEYIVPVDEIFKELPALFAGEEFDKLVHNGNWLLPGQVGRMATADGEEFSGRPLPIVPRARVYDSGGQFIGVYQYSEEKQRYQPQKIFLGGDR